MGVFMPIDCAFMLIYFFKSNIPNLNGKSSVVRQGDKRPRQSAVLGYLIVTVQFVIQN
jgi:hypothetical protein